MPPPSQASRRFWWWAKEHPKEAGVSETTAKEFTESDPGGKLPERVKDGKPVQGEPSPDRRQRLYSHPRSRAAK